VANFVAVSFSRILSHATAVDYDGGGSSSISTLNLAALLNKAQYVLEQQTNILP
jgi:hypothetical protein